MSLPLVLALVSPLLAPPPVAGASDWPQFRGPAGDGMLPKIEHPREWGEETNVAWKIEVPGEGWSTALVVGEQILLTTAVRADGAAPKGFNAGASSPGTRGEQVPPDSEVTFEVRSYSLGDGSERWRTELGKKIPAYGVHPSNTYASESPATDGERLFVTYGALGEVVALDLEGKVLWRTEVGVHKATNDFGWASSLTTSGGLVFVQNDNAESSFLLALNAESGKEAWRVERDLGSSWATPAVWGQGDEQQLVTVGPGHASAYAAKTGELVWRLEGLEGSFSASPAFDDERLYFGNSGPRSGGALVAMQADAEGVHTLGDEEADAIAWVADRAGPGFPSPLVVDGLLHVIGSQGIFSCYDAYSGEQLYRERLPESSSVMATPWSDGDEIFVLDENGKTFVLKVGLEFEVVRVNEMPGLYWATPSVAGKSLLLRSADGITCVRAE